MSWPKNINSCPNCGGIINNPPGQKKDTDTNALLPAQAQKNP